MVSEYNIRLNPNCAAVVNTGMKFKSGDKGIIFRIAVEELDTTGTTAKIVFWRANGTSVESDITGDGGIYTYKTLGNEFAVPGKTIADVKVYSGDDRVSTASFVFEVGVDTMDGLGAGTGGYSDRLEQLVSEAEEAGAMTEQAKVDLQSATANLNETEKDMEATVQNFKDAYGEVGALKPKGNWSSAISYQIRDMVYYNGFSWVCLVDNTGKEPSTANAAYWQQMTDLQSIISGTTTVGNADAVDNFHVTDLFRYYSKTNVETDINTLLVNGMYRSNKFVNYPPKHHDGQGTVIVLNYGNGNQLAVNATMGTVSLWLKQIFISPHNGKMWERYVSNKTISEWHSMNDADTVDGYHAGDLVKQHGSFLTSEQMNDSNWRDNYEGVTTNGTLVGLQSGWWYIKYFNNINADGFGAQIAIPLDGAQGYTPKYRLSVRTVWNDWKNFGDGVFLPLTGGTITQTDGVTETNVAITNSAALAARLKFKNSVKEGTILSRSDGYFGMWDITNVKNIIGTTLDGTMIIDGNNKPLHTGNSAKVVQATSAPSDTTAVWIDTANKVIKAYIDGAWTQVS